MYTLREQLGGDRNATLAPIPDRQTRQGFDCGQWLLQLAKGDASCFLARCRRDRRLLNHGLHVLHAFCGDTESSRNLRILKLFAKDDSG